MSARLSLWKVCGCVYVLSSLSAIQISKCPKYWMNQTLSDCGSVQCLASHVLDMGNAAEMIRPIALLYPHLVRHTGSTCISAPENRQAGTHRLCFHLESSGQHDATSGALDWPHELPREAHAVRGPLSMFPLTRRRLYHHVTPLVGSNRQGRA